MAVFPNAGQGAEDHVIAFLQVKPDWAFIFEDSLKAVISPRFRLGLNASEYNFISLDDVYAEYVADRFEVRAGYQTHFWGAVESFNLVDIFNQRDYTVDFFDPNEHKIGEPAIRLRTIFDEHIIDVHYFFYFTPANLPDAVNPYNPFAGQLNIDQDGSYTNTSKRLRPQFALRWGTTLGSADVGFVYFNGYDRFPVNYRVPGGGQAHSLYYEIHQVSGDVQMSLGNWLLKAEVQYLNTDMAGSFVRTTVLANGSIARQNLVPENLTAWVGGVEYTFYRAWKDTDLGVLAEYLYNSQQNLNAVAFRPFQNDFFTGLRWSRNNLGDGQLLAGVIVDLKNGSQLWRIEYSERFFDRINLLLYGEMIEASSQDPLRPFQHADNLAVQFSYVY